MQMHASSIDETQRACVKMSELAKSSLPLVSPLPPIGFGTYQSVDAHRSVLNALDAGFRLIDTARVYKNEVQVGQAIREAV